MDELAGRRGIVTRVSSLLQLIRKLEINIDLRLQRRRPLANDPLKIQTLVRGLRTS
ncbi:MAG: hypothetical protein QOJ04_1094 [Caballeronia sp.]|jgi:hypothetical protein|nr:hypothetical protein [Caballeronia sp.]